MQSRGEGVRTVVFSFAIIVQFEHSNITNTSTNATLYLEGMHKHKHKAVKLTPLPLKTDKNNLNRFTALLDRTARSQ